MPSRKRQSGGMAMAQGPGARPTVALWCDMCGFRAQVEAGAKPRGWRWVGDKLLCPKDAKRGEGAASR